MTSPIEHLRYAGAKTRHETDRMRPSTLEGVGAGALVLLGVAVMSQPESIPGKLLKHSAIAVSGLTLGYLIGKTVEEADDFYGINAAFTSTSSEHSAIE